MPPTFPIPKDMRYTQHGVYIPSTSWLTYRPSLSLAQCLSHTTAVYSHYTLLYLTNTQLAICGQSALITEALKLNELQTKHRRGTRAVTQHSGLCDVTASYTQEETITHRTLLCNSPQERIPTCTTKQHGPALMKKAVPKRSERQRRRDASLQPLQKGSFIRHQAARFYERTEMPTTQRSACSLNAALCILAPTHAPYHYTPQNPVPTHSTPTAALHGM